MKRATTMAGLLCLSIGPLAAGEAAAQDWQYASWGMTPAELVAAAGGDVRELSSPETGGRDGPVLAEGSYRAADVDFVARFHFQDGGLTAVRLTPASSDCGALQMRLLDLYGEREGWTGTRGLYQWRQEAENRLVHFGNDPRGTSGCVLIYSQLRKPDDTGL